MTWAPPQLPIALIDVDGVGADYVFGYLRHANTVLGTSYTKDNITEHDVEKSLGLSTEERNQVRMEIDRMRMARTLPVLPGFVDGVKRLAESANIFFITSSLTSSQTWEWDRRAWLDQNFGDGWGKKAQFVKDKYLFQGDIFIDDSPENVDKWATYNKWDHHKSPILWSQWYNAKHSSDSRLVRANNWDYIEKLVWDKTKKKDVLLAWTEHNQKWLDNNRQHYVAVNPYTGHVLSHKIITKLAERMAKFPDELTKDMVTWFNSIPVET